MTGRGRPTGLAGSTPTAQDLVNRDFARTEPNRLWLTDITEHPTREGKVYCAVVLDAFSRRVVGWAIDSSQTASCVVNALGWFSSRRPGTSRARARSHVHVGRGRRVLERFDDVVVEEV